MKKIFVFLFFIFTVQFIFCTERTVKDSYKYFLQLNNSYTEIEKTVLSKVHIMRITNDGKKTKSETVFCLFHKNGQCVRLKTKNKLQYFFSSSQGYWLYNKNLKTPLKISGSYTVEEFEVQDILKTDFKNEYKIIDEENGILTLERQTQKPAYKFILFKETDKGIFELTFADAKKTPIRKLVYHGGNAGGFPCFYKIDVYNLILQTDSYSSWITENITPADVPSALFHYDKLKVLSQKIESLSE